MMLIVSQPRVAAQLKSVGTTFPRRPNAARLMASVADPARGPGRLHRPTTAKTRLPTTTMLSACQRFRPKRMSTPPAIMLMNVELAENHGQKSSRGVPWRCSSGMMSIPYVSILPNSSTTSTPAMGRPPRLGSSWDVVITT
jgi:hypothetical protein